MPMEHQHRVLLLRQREATESRRKTTERAIYALMTMRNHYGSDDDSRSLLKSWVAEDKRLQVQIHNYDEFLAL
jgi:hypothetical protein